MKSFENKKCLNSLHVCIIILLVLQCCTIYIIFKSHFIACNSWTVNSDNSKIVILTSHVNEQELWNSYKKFHNAKADKVFINSSAETLHLGIKETSSPVTYILNNSSKCSQEDIINLVIIVLSAPGNFDTRSAIRGTWGFPSFTRPIVFLIGNTNNTTLQNELVEENKQHNDIVQVNFTDTDPNLTLQSIALLQWANSVCKNAQFILKVNDNIFVHVPNILNFLTEVNFAEKLIIGKMGRIKSPYSAYEPFPNISYSEFLDDSAYIICRGAIEDLLDVALALKGYNDHDKFITGPCAQFSNTSRMNENLFNAVTDIANPCSFRKVFTTVASSPKLLFTIWWHTVYQMLDSCHD